MTLRDELAELVMSDEARPMGSCSCSECGRGVADAVLASPPLQAIRAALREMAAEADGLPISYDDYLGFVGLPASVRAWVLGEEQ